MQSIIIDFPIVWALCHTLTPRARAIWFYMAVNHQSLPLPYKKVMKDLGMHRDVFYRAMQNLEDYGVACRYNGYIDFHNHDFGSLPSRKSRKTLGFEPYSQSEDWKKYVRETRRGRAKVTKMAGEGTNEKGNLAPDQRNPN